MVSDFLDFFQIVISNLATSSFFSNPLLHSPDFFFSLISLSLHQNCSLILQAFPLTRLIEPTICLLQLIFGLSLMHFRSVLASHVIFFLSFYRFLLCKGIHLKNFPVQLCHFLDIIVLEPVVFVVFCLGPRLLKVPLKNLSSIVGFLLII